LAMARWRTSAHSGSGARVCGGGGGELKARVWAKGRRSRAAAFIGPRESRLGVLARGQGRAARTSGSSLTPVRVRRAERDDGWGPPVSLCVRRGALLGCARPRAGRAAERRGLRLGRQRSGPRGARGLGDRMVELRGLRRISEVGLRSK
jgi:hypothetical protein